MFGSIDPDNPMGGLLGDLLKVIGSGPPGGDRWFEAARTLAFGVATDDGQDETPTHWCVSPSRTSPGWPSSTWPRPPASPPPRVAEAGCPSRPSDPGSGPTACSRPTARCSSRWSRPSSRAPSAVPAMDLTQLHPEGGAGLQGLLEPVRPHPRPRLPRHAIRFGRRPPGPPRLRPVRVPSALAARARGPPAGRPGNVARFAEDWSLPLQEVQLWICLRELTMHAVMTRPGVRLLLSTLLADASTPPPRPSATSSSAWARAWATPPPSKRRWAIPRPCWPTSSAPSNATSRARRPPRPPRSAPTSTTSPPSVAETLTSTPAALREPGTATGSKRERARWPSPASSGSTSARTRWTAGRSFIIGCGRTGRRRRTHPVVVGRSRPTHSGRGRRTGPLAGPHRAARLNRAATEDCVRPSNSTERASAPGRLGARGARRG